MGTELEIAGWLASSLNSRTNNLLSDPSLQTKSAELKLKKLQQVLEKIHAISWLDWKRQISRQSFKDWLCRFKDAFYLAENAIDGIEYHAFKRSSSKSSRKRACSSSSSSSSSQKSESSSSIKKALHTVLPGSSSGLFDHDYIKQLAEATKRFDELFLDISNILKVADQLEAFGGKQMAESPAWRLPTSAFSPRPIRGRDDEIEVLLRALLDTSTDSSSHKFSLLSLVGPAGIGKTELARLAYSNEMVSRHFDTKVWICVSNSFDPKRLMIEIIESASRQRPDDIHSIISMEIIRNSLAQVMKEKRFLLVLDDVWEGFIAPWADLSTLLNLGRKGSRVIVTTQLEKVAREIGSKEILHLDGLEPNDLWELLNDCALGEQEHTEIHLNSELIGREIAEKFGGSPLAAVAIGYGLKYDLTEEHWSRIARKRLGEIDRGGGGIVSVLELSYQHLPPQLKPCFLACALFPKNHCFEKDQLLQIWTALGVASSTDGDLVDDLSSRSFFVNSERVKNKFVVHAVLHELADIICEGEFFRLEGEIEETEEIAIPEKARHLYVTTDNLIKVSGALGEKEDLVSLVIAGDLSPGISQSDFMRSLEEVLKGSRRLRLLMISELPGELPKAIGDLRHLRYMTGPKNLEFPKGINKPPKLRFAIDDAEAIEFCDELP